MISARAITTALVVSTMLVIAGSALAHGPGSSRSDPGEWMGPGYGYGMMGPGYGHHHDYDQERMRQGYHHRDYGTHYEWGQRRGMRWRALPEDFPAE